MPAAPLSIALLLVAATGAGAIGLAVAPDPFAGDAAALITAGLVIAALVAVSGTLLARGRWSRPLVATTAAVWIGVGAAQTSTTGLVTALIAAAALAAVAGPWLGRWLRHLPAADGPPPEAVGALLTLVATPAALGLALGSGVPGVAWGFAAWSILLALAIARMVPGALLATRIAHPLLAITTAVVVPLPAAAVALTTGALVATLAWRRAVTVALVPVLPVPSAAVRFPPELTPSVILEAAGLDETGHRRPS